MRSSRLLRRDEPTRVRAKLVFIHFTIDIFKHLWYNVSNIALEVPGDKYCTLKEEKVMKKKGMKVVTLVLALVLCLGLGSVAVYAAGGVVNRSNSSTTYEVNASRGDWTQTNVVTENGYTTVTYTNTFRSDTNAGAISNPRIWADNELAELKQYASDRGWTLDEVSKEPDSQYATTATSYPYFWYHYVDKNGVRQKMYFQFIQQVQVKNGTLTSTWSQAKNGNIVISGMSTQDIKNALQNCRYDSYIWKTW